MPESLDDIFQFALDNITWIIFLVFMLSGIFSRSGGKKTSSTDPVASAPRESQQDNRPLAQRMAEHFGIPFEEIQEQQRQQQSQRPQQEPRYSSEGRRFTSTKNVQDNYPDLFGGKSMFADQDRDGFAGDDDKWGFDETEWGSTFEHHEDQWGGAFPDKKSSEPRIEVSG